MSPKDQECRRPAQPQRSRFALIAGGTPAVPANHLTPETSLSVSDKHLKLAELAIHPQTTHAAVRKNIKSEVRNDAGIQQLAFKKMSGVGL